MTSAVAGIPIITMFPVFNPPKVCPAVDIEADIKAEAAAEAAWSEI
jgi:hypothetical protein